MAITKYAYLISTAFPNQKVNPDALLVEIADSAIVTDTDHIDTRLPTGDYCDIYMADALSSGDEDILDALVEAHQGEDYVDTDGDTIKPVYYLEFLNIEYVNESEVKIPTGGHCRSDDNTLNLQPPSDITIDITESGVNGLDTGSEAADTWYYIWLIYDTLTETYAGLFSLSATNPTMPSAYDKKRRLGSVFNGANSNIKKWICYGHHNRKRFDWDMGVGRCRVLQDGCETEWTSIDLSYVTSPVSVMGHFQLDSWAPGKNTRYRAYASNLADGQIVLRGQSVLAVIPITDAKIEYKSDGTAAEVTITVLGWEEDL